MGFEEIRVGLAKFLGTIIVENKFISLDLWSIIHFFTGVLLFLFIYFFFRNVLGTLLIILVLLILYEFFEILMSMFTRFFIFESPINIFTDIWIALIGSLITALIILITVKVK